MQLAEITTRAVTLKDGRTVNVLALSRDGDEDGHWVTIDGEHVHIKNGKIDKGPPALMGKSKSDLSHKITAEHGEKHPVTGTKAGPNENEGKEIRHQGNRAVHTGKSETVRGRSFHEIKMLDGDDAGKSKWIPAANPPSGAQSAVAQAGATQAKAAKAEPKSEIRVGTKWTDAKGRTWEVVEKLPFGMARVRTTDFSRVGESKLSAIRGEIEAAHKPAPKAEPAQTGVDAKIAKQYDPKATPELPGMTMGVKAAVEQAKGGRFAHIPRVTKDDFVNGHWDGTEATGRFLSEETAANVANGLKGIEGKHYGVMEHSPGKWMVISKSKIAQDAEKKSATPTVTTAQPTPEAKSAAPTEAESLKNEYTQSQSFRGGIDRALSPQTREGDKPFTFMKLNKVYDANKEQINYALGIKKGDSLDPISSDIYAYRSPNRPLNYIGSEVEPGVKHTVVAGEGYLNDTMFTNKPLSPSRIHGLELTTVPHTPSQHDLATKVSTAIAGKGPVELVQDVHEENPRGVVIAKSANEKGKWQKSNYDSHGFSGHSVHGSKEDAIKEAINEGYTPTHQGLLDDLSRQDSWKQGVKSMQVKRYSDQLTSKKSGWDDNAELMKVNHEQGPDAAIAWIAKHKMKAASSMALSASNHYVSRALALCADARSLTLSSGRTVTLALNADTLASLAQCSNCKSYDVRRIPSGTGGRSLDMCRRCGSVWQHVPGSLTAEQHSGGAMKAACA